MSKTRKQTAEFEGKEGAAANRADYWRSDISGGGGHSPKLPNLAGGSVTKKKTTRSRNIEILTQKLCELFLTCRRRLNQGSAALPPQGPNREKFSKA